MVNLLLTKTSGSQLNLGPARRRRAATGDSCEDCRNGCVTLGLPMIIKVGFDIEFEMSAPTPMILMLYVHPSRQPDLRSDEKIVVEPKLPLTDFTDLYGNRCARIFAPAGNLRLSLEALIEDSGLADEQRPEAQQHKV